MVEDMGVATGIDLDELLTAGRPNGWSGGRFRRSCSGGTRTRRSRRLPRTAGIVRTSDFRPSESSPTVRQPKH
jgi:hypothetical protein